jgi:hypothetical protein
MLRESPRSSHDGLTSPGRRLLLTGLSFHSLTEAQVVEHILTTSRAKHCNA